MKHKHFKLLNSLLLLSVAQWTFAVEFAMFGDVKLSDSSQSDVDNGFALGQLDFFATTKIDDKSRVFIEYVLENGGDGLVIDLERLWIAREINNSLTIAAGRFHSPLGYWNRTYHHGSFMQDSISRPFFLDFEDGAGGVLPVHAVGIMAWGSFYFTAGEITYETFVSNGSSINTDEFGFNASPDGKPEIEINDSGDNNNNKSTGLRVSYLPDEQMAFSLFIINNDVAESGDGINTNVTSGESLVDQIITGFDFRFNQGAFDTLTEFYRFDNDSNTNLGGSFTGEAYFSQFGWRFNESFKALIRYENLSFDPFDSYFLLLGAEEAKHRVFGLRYEMSSSQALKFELNSRKLAGGDSDTSYTLQWTFIVH